MNSKIYFEVISSLGKKIRITKDYWDFIVEKHPPVKGREKEVKETLINPIEIRRSKEGENIYLYYKKLNMHSLCAVCRHLNGDGFIITIYTTDRIKEGETIWKR